MSVHWKIRKKRPKFPPKTFWIVYDISKIREFSMSQVPGTRYGITTVEVAADDLGKYGEPKNCVFWSYKRDEAIEELQSLNRADQIING